MTLFVSPSGGNTDCSEANPCAFVAAFAKIGGDGYTIQMAPGTYTGNGYLIDYGVTIQGPLVAPGADPLAILKVFLAPGSYGRVMDVTLGTQARVNLQFITLQKGNPP